MTTNQNLRLLLQDSATIGLSVWPIAIVLFVLMLFGPTIEARIAPIRLDRDLHVIKRTNGSIAANTPGQLCWEWTFTKLRDIGSPDLDAYLYINDEPGGVRSVYQMQTGRPWGLVKYKAKPRPEPYVYDYCTDLPPYVLPSQTVRLKQTSYYPGFLGMWTLPVESPEVISPGS